MIWENVMKNQLTLLYQVQFFPLNMKYLKKTISGYKRHNIPSIEKKIQREKQEPKSSRTQNQVIIETNIRQNQNVIENVNEELEVKSYPKRKLNKRQKTVEQPKIDLECPSCKQKLFFGI